jgi:hypothetical protein
MNNNNNKTNFLIKLSSFRYFVIKTTIVWMSSKAHVLNDVFPRSPRDYWKYTVMGKCGATISFLPVILSPWIIQLCSTLCSCQKVPPQATGNGLESLNFEQNKSFLCIRWFISDIYCTKRNLTNTVTKKKKN